MKGILNKLIEQGESILEQTYCDSMGFMEYVPNSIYDGWKRRALMFVQRNYPNELQLPTLEKHVQSNNSSEHCVAIVSILKA
jgi:hypothetical protein